MLGASALLTGCATKPPQPQNINNVCEIFREHPKWYTAAKKSQKKWGVPIHVQMAIVRHESEFIADAKPPRRKVLWIIPWKRQSTAYGYSQALDATWKGYKNANGKYWAERDDFADAVDFIGWYNNQIYRQLGINRKDAYALYLAYHEGPYGYKNGTYWRKKWLRNVAKQVERRSKTYQQQLSKCQPALEEKTKKKFSFLG